MTNRNYNTINELPISLSDLEQWASSRETDRAVALAIHAIADESRSADAIWEDPTPAEWDHVRVAVQEYVEHGDYSPKDEYHWGEERFSV